MLPACVLIWRNTVHTLSYLGGTYYAKPDSSKLACVTFISYSLLSVGQLQGEITFQRVTYSFHFIIHAIRVFCIFKKALILGFLYVWATLKKWSGEPFKKRFAYMCIGWSIWSSMPAAREGGNKPTLHSRCVAKWSPRQEKTLPESGVQWHWCQNKLYTNMHMETALDSKVTTKNDRIFVV